MVGAVLGVKVLSRHKPATLPASRVACHLFHVHPDPLRACAWLLRAFGQSRPSFSEEVIMVVREFTAAEYRVVTRAMGILENVLREPRVLRKFRAVVEASAEQQ